MSKKIKSVTTFTTEMANQQPAHTYKSDYEEYDLNSNVIKDIFWDEMGHVLSSNSFLYDSEDNLLEESSYGEENKLIMQVYYYRNTNGKLEGCETTYEDCSKLFTKYSYSADGLKRTGKVTTETGESDGHDEEWLDDRGNVLQLNQFDPDGHLEYREENRYDQESRLLQSEQYDEDSKLMKRLELQYDEHGNCTSEITSNPDGDVLERITRKYNDKNLLAEETAEDFGVGTQTVMERTIYKYNEQGHCNKEETYNEHNQIIASRINDYNADGQIIAAESFERGYPYNLEPGIPVSTDFQHLRFTYEYEFYA